MSSTVAIARCAEYDLDLVRAALERSFELLGGLAGFIRPGDRVLLKPNILLAAPPERAVCTHPIVLRAAIGAFRDLGCRVLVAEQPGIMSAAEARRAFEVSGIQAACEMEGVECRLFRPNGYVAVPLPDGKHLKVVMLPRDFQEVDHVVSVAKLKSHMQATYTGAVKNFYGAIPTLQRKQIHRLAKYVPFSEGIVDVFAAVRPAFGIIDGIVGMEGKGPNTGKPRRLGLLFASQDLVALDRVASTAVGWDKHPIVHLEDAAARGLGEDKLKRITVLGEKLEDVRVDFEPVPTSMQNPPRFLIDTLYNYWSIKPAVIPKNCNACGSCVAACPTAAIKLNDQPIAVIDYDKCIECFCCHEMCAYDAIGERASLLKRCLGPVRQFVRRLRRRS